MPNKVERVKTNYPGVYYIIGKASDGRPERIYYIMYRKAGKLIEEPAGRQFKNGMTSAKASHIRSERIEGKSLPRKEARKAAAVIKWTVDHLFEQYVGDRPDNKCAKGDRYWYRKHLQSLGSKEPSAIAQIDVHRLRIKLSKALKPKTVKNILELLGRIINFGAKKGLCAGLSFKIEFPRVNNLKTEDLTPEQLSNLLEAIDTDHDLQAANFMRMALFTGMRRGELFKLKWEDVDFERGFIHIIQPKGGKDQTIPLNQAAREVLENHPRDDSPFVFPGRGGKQRTEIRRPVDRIRKAAGLPRDFRPLHGLRHTYASMLASSGQVELHVLQKLLTHKTSQMTQRYAHLRDEAMRRASDLAGDLMSKAVANGNHLKAVKD